MANPFRDMSVIMQGLVALAIAVILVLVGLYVPVSPVAQERSAYDEAVQQRTKLNQEVTQLQVYKQRYGGLKQQMNTLGKQLDTLKTIFQRESQIRPPGARGGQRINVELAETDFGKICRRTPLRNAVQSTGGPGPTCECFSISLLGSTVCRASSTWAICDFDDPVGTTQKARRIPFVQAKR